MRKTQATKTTSRKSPATTPKTTTPKTTTPKTATQKTAPGKTTTRKPSPVAKKISRPQRAATRTKRPIEPDLDDEDEISTPLQSFLVLRPGGVDLDTAVEAVRAVGLLSSYETLGAIGATLEDVLLNDRGTDPEPFLIREFPFVDQTDDLIADLNRIVPGPPVCRQIDVTREWIEIERSDGRKRTIEYTTLRDVADAYDTELQLAGSPWRMAFLPLGQSGCDGFLALDPAGVDRLRSVGLLPARSDEEE